MKKRLVKLLALSAFLILPFPANADPSTPMYSLSLHAVTSGLYDTTVPSDVRNLHWEYVADSPTNPSRHEGGGWLAFWTMTGGYYSGLNAFYPDGSHPATWYTQYPIFSGSTAIGWSDFWYCACSGGGYFQTLGGTSGNLYSTNDYIP